MRSMQCLFILGLIVAAGSAMAMDSVTGTAGYRERIAMPPDVIFEARLEEVSRVDAPSRLIGSTVIEDAGNPPYKFSIDYDPADIDDRSNYAVRAMLRHGGELLFTTNGHIPVLTLGAGSEVEIMMVRVGAEEQMPARLIGEFVYFADAASFRPCGSGESYPVAMEGLYLALESAYLGARAEPRQPLVAVLEGTVAPREGMEGGMRDMLVIDRTVGVVSGLTCERAMADSAVENTYWRILSLGGDPIEVAEGEREPSIRFLPQQGGFSATVGCNTLNGGYELSDPLLSLSLGAMTMMACPPPLDEVERRLVEALGEVAEIIVTGPTAELRDADGNQLAFLGAVALL